MLKKTYMVFMAILLVLSIVPMALAEDNETVENEIESAENIELDENLVDEETEKELEILNDIPGKKYRRLQLKREIDSKLRVSKYILSYIEDIDTNTSLEEIENQILLFEDLFEQVSELDIESESFAEEFVTLKKEGLEIVRKFRELTKDLLNSEDKEILKEEVKKIHKEIRKEYKEESENLREDVNKDRTLRMLEKQDFKEIYDMLESGEITTKEAMDLVKGKIKDMTKEERKELIQKTKEMKNKATIRAKEMKENVLKNKEHIMKNMKNRLNNVDRKAIKGKIEKLRLDKKNLKNRIRLKKSSEKTPRKNLKNERLGMKSKLTPIKQSKPDTRIGNKQR